MLEKLQTSGDFPTTKLAALQKVLQSDFLNAIREVYEHVYETVDIQGSQDVRASATAKATVAAFAASEGHAHPRVVELPKTEEGIVNNHDLYAITSSYHIDLFQKALASMLWVEGNKIRLYISHELYLEELQIDMAV